MNEDNFNIDKFVTECTNYDLPDLIDFIEKRHEMANHHSKSLDEYQKHNRKAFSNFALELLFFLNTGIKPRNMQASDFVKTKPIMESLVRKGQLKAAILEYYQ